ncbi:Inner membrane protein YihN [Arthrobacter sp. SO5]|uniref:MFS transporter n=1 Tax=Arthrobacter sp. SO5 TaxID=1897055 RepID=UPI001E646B05|nr:MFS transporter [Arthrobacter sp. SO5]MCB5276047.1 Inner membrane protein YihN [Arthrobacter sp. SO5]
MPKLAQSRKIFELVLLILAAGSIYPLVYLRQNFEKTILIAFDMNQAELANLYTMLGIIFVIGYLPSGWLADRFPVKFLIIFSLLLTAGAGLWYAQVPDKSSLVYLYLIWGFATVFTFWSAILKTVNILADANEEGRYFGALDGGRGLVEAILASAAVAVFAVAAGPGEADGAATRAGFQAVVYMYCIAIIVIAVGLFFLMPSGRDKEIKAEQQSKGDVKSTFAAIVRILRIREVWVMIVILFCGYTLFWGHYYFSGFLNVNHGVSQVSAGVVTVIVLWMRPIGGFGGGFLADKFGRSRVLAISMTLTAVLLITLAVLPGASPIGLIYVLIVAAGLVMYVIRGVYWSILDECRVPAAVTGIAIGIISFFGYLPDIFLPQISSAIYTNFGDNIGGANNAYFVVTAVIGLIGAGAAMYFTLLLRRRAAAEALDAKAAPEPVMGA